LSTRAFVRHRCCSHRHAAGRVLLRGVLWRGVLSGGVLRRGVLRRRAARREIVMDEASYAEARRRMVAEIAAEAALTAGYTGAVRFDERVMEAMGRVPRHAFVPPELAEYAYLNRPLPIGHDKTVSQPYMVALMTHMLSPRATDVVLEVGTGAGYQAAVLACLVKQVYTVELIPALAHEAARRLQRLGVPSVEVHVANGYYGWAAHAPYDRIVVTAACELVPTPLIEQLRPRGRMIVPTGVADHQSLTLLTKDNAGIISLRDLLPVRFSAMDEPGGTTGAA
jgi:protein-L-isoaspartate(D-aspartate) O-methyltransferase